MCEIIGEPPPSEPTSEQGSVSTAYNLPIASLKNGVGMRSGRDGCVISGIASWMIRRIPGVARVDDQIRSVTVR